MAFSARDAETIRQWIRTTWASRYRALGKELSVVVDSDADILAHAIAILQELLELQALNLTNEIFPDKCSEDIVLRHAGQIGMARKPAGYARLRVTVTGAAGQTSACVGKTLNASDGNKYTAVDSSNNPLASITLDGAGNASVLFLAQTAGAAPTKAAGTRLTWSSAPTAFDAVDVVASIDTTGSDIETLAALRYRILSWWLERPGAGNEADFADWAESRPGIFRAYVYPVAHKTLGPETLGAVRVLLLGDPASRTPASPFGLAAGNVADVKAYFFGTDAYASDGGKVSSDVYFDDIDVDVPTPQTVEVKLSVVLGPGYSFPFAGNFTIDAGSTSTIIKLTANPTGTISEGDLVAIANPNLPGGFDLQTVTQVNADNIHVTEMTNGYIPVATKKVYPAPNNWAAMRDAILAIFARLGPGDVDALLYPDSARWPTSTTVGPYTLYRAALVAAVMGLPGLESAVAGIAGVVSAAVGLPVTDLTPAAFTQLVPGDIYFTA